MSILITNGTIITASEKYEADIYIDKETIASIGKDLQVSVDMMIDANGKYVIPGGIDVHTHLDMPLGEITSSDDFESGTIAAAFGGTTTIIDFPTQMRGQKIPDALEIWHKKAAGHACIDYGFHMIVTDYDKNTIKDLDWLIKEGVSSYKLFMAYPQSLMLDDATIFKIMRSAEKNGALICMHAENGGVIDVLVQNALAEGKRSPIYHALTRPASSEGEAVNRTIALAEMAGIPVYIVHLSTYDGLERVAEARDRGLPVFAETCPQYLFLSIEDMQQKEGFEAAKYVLTPPLREKWHQEALWNGLSLNDIQVVSTDHCPFCFNGQKEIGKDDFSKIPNGIPGIENRLQLLYHGGVVQGRISLNRWVELCATAPAKLFGLYPQKGTIAPGSDADLVIWDGLKPSVISAKTHHMRVDYNVYEGFTVSGAAETVISRGEVIVEKKQFTGRKGRGHFVKRTPFSL